MGLRNEEKDDEFGGRRSIDSSQRGINYSRESGTGNKLGVELI